MCYKEGFGGLHVYVQYAVNGPSYTSYVCKRCVRITIALLDTNSFMKRKM